MKTNILLMGAALVSLLTGCASAPVALVPAGPNATVIASTASEGGLQVYSRLIGHREGNNPTWRQHSDYDVYDFQGVLVKHVENTVGHYAKDPRNVDLPAGNYVVKAQAKDYLMVKVPVTIEHGRLTTLHLDDQWTPPSDVANNDVVRMPNGQPIGLMGR